MVCYLDDRNHHLMKVACKLGYLQKTLMMTSWFPTLTCSASLRSTSVEADPSLRNRPSVSFSRHMSRMARAVFPVSLREWTNTSTWGRRWILRSLKSQTFTLTASPTTWLVLPFSHSKRQHLAVHHLNIPSHLSTKRLSHMLYFSQVSKIFAKGKKVSPKKPQTKQANKQSWEVT